MTTKKEHDLRSESGTAKRSAPEHKGGDQAHNAQLMGWRLESRADPSSGPSPAQAPQSPMPQQQQHMLDDTEKMVPRQDQGEESYRGTGKVVRSHGRDHPRGDRRLISGRGVGCARNHPLTRGSELSGVIARGGITDESFARSLVSQAIDECGRLDIRVDNAARQATARRWEA